VLLKQEKTSYIGVWMELCLLNTSHTPYTCICIR